VQNEIVVLSHDADLLLSGFKSYKIAPSYVLNECHDQWTLTHYTLLALITVCTCTFFIFFASIYVYRKELQICFSISSIDRFPNPWANVLENVRTIIVDIPSAGAAAILLYDSAFSLAKLLLLVFNLLLIMRSLFLWIRGVLRPQANATEAESGAKQLALGSFRSSSTVALASRV
jgi:hypothetical protein